VCVCVCVCACSPGQCLQQLAGGAVARGVEAEGHDEGFVLELRDEGRRTVHVDQSTRVPNERRVEQRRGAADGCTGNNERY
jgi:hypothetical protein